MKALSGRDKDEVLEIYTADTDQMRLADQTVTIVGALEDAQESPGCFERLSLHGERLIHLTLVEGEKSNWAEKRRNTRIYGRVWLPGTDETQNYELPIAVERSPQLPTRRKRDRDREERIRQAGGPKPSLREKAYALARERATVKTRDFTAIGIPRHYLAWMCEEGLLVKVGYGVDFH